MNQIEIVYSKKDKQYYVKYKNKIIGTITSQMNELIEKNVEARKEIVRLRYQLARNHHIECICSFCKPVNE